MWLGVPNLGPQLPEGKLEDFQVDTNLKQPVFCRPRDTSR
jgi:hypothetical protein